MNSLIGKLSQKTSFPKTKYVQSAEEIQGTFNASHQNITDFMLLGNSVCELQIEEEKDVSCTPIPNRKTNPILGAFVTALSRIDMHKQIMTLVAHDLVPAYTDTDSLIFFGKKNKPLPFQMSGSLGDFRREYSCEPQSFCCIGKKNYALTFEPKDRQETVLKVRGISFKSEVSQKAVSFEDFQRFLENKIPPKIPQNRLYKKKTSVRNQIVPVKLATTLTFNRLLLASPNYKTIPYGYVSK